MRVIKVASFQAFQELYESYLQQQQQQPASQQQSGPNSSPGASHCRSLVLLFVAGGSEAKDALADLAHSWCPDCRAVKPVLEATIEKFKFNNHLALALIDVGDRDTWKKSDNLFRSHKLQVDNVPTMISLKTNERLVEAECADPAKVSHLVANSM